MKKNIFVILLLLIPISLFASNNHYYYGFENRTALSAGIGYDFYKMEIGSKDDANKTDIILNGMTLNFKAEMPLKTLSGISLFLDTHFMLPNTSYIKSGSNYNLLKDSTFLKTLAGNQVGKATYQIIDFNLGMSMLGSINPSFLVYYGGGLDILVANGCYKYKDSTQTLLYGYMGLGFFQTVGFYYEFTDNVAINFGFNTSYDFAIYNYQKSSENSSLNKFEKINANGTNYLARLMMTYNW